MGRDRRKEENRPVKTKRSSKCSLKQSDKGKIITLKHILKEYGKVVNFFIKYFWDDCPSKADLLSNIVNLPPTWLSARLRKVAAREAIDMILSSKRVFGSNKEKIMMTIEVINEKVKKIKPDSKYNRRKINNLYCKLKKLKMKHEMIQPGKPKHKGKRMHVSSTIAQLQTPKKKGIFDAWLHLASIGNNVILNFPIKFHDQFNKWKSLGKRLESYIITENYVQFSFEIEMGEKKKVKKLIGIDTGINALASTSNKKQYGTDIKSSINRIKRCKKGSKGQKRAIRALRQRIDEVAKEVTSKVDLIVVENLKNMNNNSKLKGQLSKNIRSSIGTWNYRYWLERVKQCCENSRTVFRSVNPAYTSQRCSSCGHTDRRNRNGEMFKCQSCGYTGNADINAALNILFRFLTGHYGACYKPLITQLDLSRF